MFGRVDTRDISAISFRLISTRRVSEGDEHPLHEFEQVTVLGGGKRAGGGHVAGDGARHEDVAQVPTLVGQVDVDLPAIARVAYPLDEAVAFEAVERAHHRCLLDRNPPAEVP